MPYDISTQRKVNWKIIRVNNTTFSKGDPTFDKEQLDAEIDELCDEINDLTSDWTPKMWVEFVVMRELTGRSF